MKGKYKDFVLFLFIPIINRHLLPAGCLISTICTGSYFGLGYHKV